MRQSFVLLFVVLFGLVCQPALAQTPTPSPFPVTVTIRYGAQESQVYDITLTGEDDPFEVLNHFDGFKWRSGKVPAQMNSVAGQMINGGLPTVGQQIRFLWAAGVLTLTTNNPEMVFEYTSSLGHHGWLTGNGTTSLQIMTVKEAELTENEVDHLGEINITASAGKILMGPEQTELRLNQPVMVTLTDQNNNPLVVTVKLTRDEDNHQGVIISGTAFCFSSADLVAETLVQYQGCVAPDKPTTVPFTTSLHLLITPPVQQ